MKTKKFLTPTEVEKISFFEQTKAIWKLLLHNILNLQSLQTRRSFSMEKESRITRKNLMKTRKFPTPTQVVHIPFFEQTNKKQFGIFN